MTEPRTLDAALTDWAQRFADHAAAIGSGARLRFGELDGAADLWARRLAAAGVQPGARVALLAANQPAWLAAAFGVWRAAATLVPVSTFVTPRELGEILADADVEAMIVQPRMGARDLLAMAAALPTAQRPPRLLSLIEDSAPAAAPAAGAPLPSAESTACILYTSGTTGAPKGVMLSHRAILATVEPTAERGGLVPGDVALSTLPLFWVAGLVIRALPTLASGAALLTLETFTADGLLAALRAEQPSALHLRPPQVGQLLAHAEFDPAGLSAVRRGGGRVDWFAPHLDAERVRFITGYGMTETAGYVTALDWRDAVAVRATGIGTPLPGVELRIVDGEVRVRGPGLFSGYHKQPPGTGVDADGFFCTGDLGRIDADGTFHFSGRSKDLLRIKGINVSPVEVESVLGAHPAVDSVYVVGVPPDGLDQELVALVVARDHAPLPEAALRAHAATTLSHYKRPTYYVALRRDEVPLGGTAKPHRAALAALATDRLRSG
ncbi:MAG: class I adenylate-forming enzyme family protein [bacterium]